MWDQNVGLNQLLEATDVMCFAAKWYGNDEVLFYSQFKDGKAAIIDAAYELLNQADIVVHFNGRTFDMPHLRREFLLAGKTPFVPVLQIDLLQVARQNFKFPSNKLQYVAKALGVGEKMKNSGHELWIRCLAYEPDAWAEMEEYNRQDVIVTEGVFTKLRPWIKNQPHFGLFSGEVHCCPSCGSNDLRANGNAYTNTAVYQQFRCAACGSNSRSVKSEARTDTRTNNA